MKFFLCGALLLLSQSSLATPHEHLIIAIKDNSYKHVKQFLDEGAAANGRTLPLRGPGTISILEFARRCNVDREILELLLESAEKNAVQPGALAPNT